MPPHEDEPPSPTPGRRPRPSPEVRRRQLLELAARMLDEHGAGGVEIVEVARRAGVTRPVVYRLFPTRQALLQAVLDDFEAELAARSRDAMISLLGGSLGQIVEAFVEAFCDTIVVKGKGAFHLMFALSPEPELSRLGRAALRRIVAPFQDEMARLTGRSPDEAVHLVEILIAAGRTAVDGWLEGPLDRATAVRTASRAVTALLVEFSRPEP